jgi:hypothetical protein
MRLCSTIRTLIGQSQRLRAPLIRDHERREKPASQGIVGSASRQRLWLASRCVGAIRRSHRALLGGLLAGLIGATATRAMAEEGKVGPNVMPYNFRVDELSIRLSRQTANTAYSPWEIHLSGTDGGSLTYDGKLRSFPYSANKIVALLNALYEIHFFDLPSEYASQPRARLNDDGGVSLDKILWTDEGSNRLCVKVASYEKCVRYGGNEMPPELDRIFQGIFADAPHLAGER